MDQKSSPAAIPTEPELDAEIWRCVAVFEAAGRPIEFRREAESVVAKANSTYVGFVRSNPELQEIVRAQVAVELVLGAQIPDAHGYDPTPIDRSVIRYAIYWAAKWCLGRSRYGLPGGADRVLLEAVNVALRAYSSFPGWSELVLAVDKQARQIAGTAAGESPLVTEFWNALRQRIDILHRDYFGTPDAIRHHAVLTPVGRQFPRSVVDVCRVSYLNDLGSKDYWNGYSVTIHLEEVLRDEVAANLDISFLQRCGVLPSSPSWTYVNGAHLDRQSNRIQRAFGHQMYDRDAVADGDSSGPSLSWIEFAGRIILAALEVREIVGSSNRSTVQEIVVRISRYLFLDRRTYGLQFLRVLARDFLLPFEFPSHPDLSSIGDAWVNQVRETFRNARRRSQKIDTPQMRLQRQAALSDRLWDDVFEVVHARLTGVSARISSASLAQVVCELIDSPSFRTLRAVQEWEGMFAKKGALAFWSDLYLNAVRGLAQPLSVEKSFPPAWVGAVALIALGGPVLLGEYSSAVEYVVFGAVPGAPRFDSNVERRWAKVNYHRRVTLNSRANVGSPAQIEGDRLRLAEATETARKSIERIRQIESWARAAGIAEINRRPCIITPSSTMSELNQWSIPRSVFAVMAPGSADPDDKMADTAAFEFVMAQHGGEAQWPSALSGNKPHFVEVPRDKESPLFGVEARFSPGTQVENAPEFIRRDDLHSVTNADQLATKFDNLVRRHGVPDYEKRTFLDRLRIVLRGITGPRQNHEAL